MILGIYTDNHWCKYSSINRKRGNKYSLRLENQIESINWVESTAKEYNCTKIIHLGDFFDKPELNAEEISALKDIKWNDLEHIFLVGNHEMGTADLEYNSTNVLSKIGQVIDKPYMDVGFGYRLILLPYILENNRKPLNEIINNLFISNIWETQEVKRNIILSHNDIKGIRYGQYESKIGFDIKEINDNCDLFINGHLHNQTQINEKIINLGNLTGQNFSEDASKYSHCMAILDTDTLEVKLINNPYAFNFYKLEIGNIQDLENKILSLQDNCILSIKCPLNIINEAKQLISKYEKIIESRLIAIPDKNNNTTIEQCSLTQMDHIEEFRHYIFNELEWNELLEDELNQL